MSFLSDQKIGVIPPTLIFFPKSPDQNSEIAILFSILEKPNNYVFGTIYSSTVPVGGAISYNLWPAFTHRFVLSLTSCVSFDHRGNLWPRVKSFRWFGITVCDSMNALQFRPVKDISDKLRLGYSKIVANPGHYRRRALTRLYSNFWDHSVLFCSGIRPLLLTGDLKRIRIDYYRYCKFLLYPPRSYQNTKLVKKYCATDISGAFEKLSAKLAIEALYRLGCFHRLIRLFSVCD